MNTAPRTRYVIAPIIALALACFAEPAAAGCGCLKPPPPLAAVRPAFAPSGGEIALFDAGLVAGETYTVSFGSDPDGVVDATALSRRDFADGVVKPQLVVAVPKLPLGPTAITVTQGVATIFTVPASDFTVLQQPIPMSEANLETVATCYHAAVGADGTTYFPLDISDVGARMLFSGAIRGYRFTFDSEDIAIYNSQGVLMQLLGPDEAPIFSIEDDQAGLPVGTVPLPQVSAPNDSTVRVDFDGTPLTDLNAFTPVVGNFSGLRKASGTGGSDGLEFDASQNTQERAVLRDFQASLYRSGARIDLAMDVRFTDNRSQATVLLGISAGGGGTAFLKLQPDQFSQVRASFLSGANGAPGTAVATSNAAPYGTDWYRAEATFVYDGTNILAVGKLSAIGPNGVTAPTTVLQLATTFSNPLLEANATVLGGFGFSSPAGANPDDTRFDNFVMSKQGGTATGSGGGDPEGDGVDQAVRSFRLTYDRHEFLTYRLAHATDPNFFHDPADPAWHADGSRHIDHEHLIVAIKGRTAAGTLPEAGQTPAFDFRTVTTLADAPAPPTLTRVFTGCPCAQAPAPDCRQAGSSKLAIRDATPDRRDSLSWKWERGEAMEAARLGHPMSTDNAALCIYDESGPEPARILRAAAPAGGTCPGGREGKPCWHALGKPFGSRGFKYRDRSQSQDGLDTIAITPGEAGKAKVGVKGLRENLPLPTLPLGAPIRVQLQMTNGTCWEARYAPFSVKKNTAEVFKAKN